MIKLFDIENNVVKPGKDCYAIDVFKEIIKIHKNNAGKIFAFYHYMCDLNPDTNSFANVSEDEKVEIVSRAVYPEIDLDDDLIIEGLELALKLYETPNYRIFKAFKILMEKLAREIAYTYVSLNGDDGNIGEVQKANKTYQELKIALKDSFKEFQDELGTAEVKGKGTSSYDAGKSDELD